MTAPPPFSALRVLEAASRHRSYTGAAKELNVTHSAVSQSIRRLEASLGATLFERRGGLMEPSEAALKLAQTYSQAANALEQAIRQVQGGSDLGALSLLVPPAIGGGWLIAKLDRMRDALPDIEIGLTTNPASAHDAQILISSSPAVDDATIAELSLFPVRAPGDERIASLAAMLDRPLLVEADAAWRDWAQLWELDPAALQHRTFDDATLLLESAAQGAGPALTHVFVAESYLDEGRLEALPYAAPASAYLCLRANPEVGAAEPVSRLVMWLKLEAARSAARLRDRLK